MAARRASGASVTLVGAGGSAARLAALMLRVSPWVAHLVLHDRRSARANLHALATTLRRDLPARAAVSAHAGMQLLPEAMRNSEVVILMMGHERGRRDQKADVFEANAPIVEAVAKAVAAVAPNALLAVMTPPVNCTLPLAVETLARAAHPAPWTRALGVAPAAIAAGRALAARATTLLPATLRLPVVGGLCHESAVPVLSSASPPGAFALPKRALAAVRDQMRAEFEGGRVTGGEDLSVGYAAAALAELLAQAALGAGPPPSLCALVRSSVLSFAPYLVTPVALGPTGIEINLGLPQVSPEELELLDRALTVLDGDVALAVARARAASQGQGARGGVREGAAGAGDGGGAMGLGEVAEAFAQRGTDRPARALQAAVSTCSRIV